MNGNGETGGSKLEEFSIHPSCGVLDMGQGVARSKSGCDWARIAGHGLADGERRLYRLSK